MNRKLAPHLLFAALLLCMTTAVCPIAVAQWTQPTAEELSMTSQPQVPGASAVYLYREEKTEDKFGLYSVYVRLKVLTDRGKVFGTVELPYASSTWSGSAVVEDIAGRTIQTDGSVVPLVDKPLKKMIEKNGDMRYMAKVFSLPDVRVGSILEYRYNIRLSDHYFVAPSWYIQSELFTRKAYYRWQPTGETLVDNEDGGKLTSSIAWSPMLPAGTQIKQTHYAGVGVGNDANGHWLFELDMHDVPPAIDEEHMPPTKSLTYRVLFYYTPYQSHEDFWKNKGKSWSKRKNKFIGPGPGVRAEADRLVLATDSPEQKLKKLYDSVMQMENTDFTREHSATEEKAEGLKQIRDTDDILARKRGSSDQLTALFVGMARAAGLKAYIAVVTNRDQHLFTTSYMTMSQLDDDLAIVNLDGKDQYFDPGSRYCPFGQIAWKHSFAGGLRQLDSGATAIITSPGVEYKTSSIQRVANLSMDEQGVIAGKVSMKYTGSPALRWRHAALQGDETSLHKDLELAMKTLLPSGIDVTVSSVEGLKAYEQPLMVTYSVKGTVGVSTGKRLVLPADLFEANQRPEFTHEKRESPVYFDFPYMTLDAVRITLPTGTMVESLPKAETTKLLNLALYSTTAESTPTSVTVRRNFIMGDILLPITEYKELRAFYAKVENKDQEPIVLTHAASQATSNHN